MKKLIMLALSFCILNSSFPLINASENKKDTKESCEPCKIQVGDLDGVSIQNKVFNEAGELQSFQVIVPLPAGAIPDTSQSRGIITALVSIIVGAYKACKVTWISTGGFNPCSYLALALGRKVVGGITQWVSSDAGSWRVEQTSTYGKIPGCEPYWSQQSNGWYYSYNYYKV